MWIPRSVEVFASRKAAPIKKNKDLKMATMWDLQGQDVTSEALKRNVRDGEEAKAAALKEEATCWENNITSALSHI